MTSFDDLRATDSRTVPSIHSRTGLPVAALAAAILIAGCGSSSTIGVGQENKANEALATSGGAEAPTSTTAGTPASGPLSKEPKVTPPSGAPPSKLVVKDIIKGTGAEAKAGGSVTVNYVGVLYNGGKEFDASWRRGKPSTFSLAAVIPGWSQGIPGMKVGGRRELIVPAALGYGPKGAPPAIPPNAALVFVVDLLGT